MASTINESCTLCSDCVKVCPTGSIFKGGRTYVIDSDTCTECRLCVPVCPVEAIENPRVPPRSKKKKKKSLKA